MDCEICGRSAKRLFLISLDNTRMEVCEKCVSYGTIIKEIRKEPKKIERVIIEEEPENEIIDDYFDIIKKERERLGLTQEELARGLDEPISLIKRIENRKMVPSEKLAKKIERVLGVKIYKK